MSSEKHKTREDKHLFSLLPNLIQSRNSVDNLSLFMWNSPTEPTFFVWSAPWTGTLSISDVLSTRRLLIFVCRSTAGRPHVWGWSKERGTGDEFHVKPGPQDHSQLFFNGNLYKTDTSLRRTPCVGPGRFFSHFTVIKVPIRRTPL